jgi:8-oxo-dGTP diphosphatase
MSTSTNPFTGRIRPRACGLIVKGGRLLLVKINAPTRPEPFWMPPGGGIDFGERAAAAAEREILEETGLSVKSGQLVFVSEYISDKWHALEYYFRCELISGKARLGRDPEISDSAQMLEDIRWMDVSTIKSSAVFPEFIRDYAEEIVTGGPMAVRYLPVQGKG